MPELNTLEPQSALQSDLKATAAPPMRIASIDILRAMTMVLMIFVNDLWSLTGTPEWLEHVSREADGMGLADTVFPAFLFIVGMSLPFALSNRRKKGDTNLQLAGHILSRTLALLVMGVFLVNGESINAAATGLPRLVWNPLCCIAFLLIWNIYPKTASRSLVNTARAAGVLMLIVLAVVYRGGSEESIGYFSPKWWGILGLIGWSYLVAALVTAFSSDKFYLPLAAWIIFSILSMLSNAGMIPDGSFLQAVLSPLGGGTLAAFPLGGVLVSFLFRYYREQKANTKMTIVLLVITAILIALGIYTRTFWGISKLRATPAWLYLCSAFTIIAFLAIYWVADVGRKANWFNVIKPAGTDTLLCYLIPYFAYSATNLLNVHLPQFMLTGGVGLIKSFLFALLCVGITAVLSRSGVRLKL